ncbi:MAG: hypothetical protein ABSG46_08980 [Candidatus Binataceae bacterium]|jgi:hypothetical protein
MKISSKVVAAAAGLALAAIVSASGQPALGAASKPGVLAKAPPTYLIGANGLSVDGFWSDEGEGAEECYYCDNSEYCGCFLADSSDGGGGSFQMNGAANTPVTYWTIEIDYVGSPANTLPTPESTSICLAASGYGYLSEGTGTKANLFYFETTGQVCDTYAGNATYTGSYVLEYGENAFSNATGSGGLNLGILDGVGPEYVNQIQFTGNLAQ